MRILMVILLLITSVVMAEQHDEQAEQLALLDKEISALYQESLTKTGSARNVVEMQLLNKNDELRGVIKGLIDSRTDATVPMLLKHVNQQVTFIAQASDFLAEKITAEEAKLDEATQEEKLSVQKGLDDARRFYTRLLGEQWVNYKWLELLGAPDPKSAGALVEDISHRLEFMSASLAFNSQQESLLFKQLKTASEGEKPSVQLEHLLTQRNVASDIDNLKFLVDLANSMEIDTTRYTQQIFEVTGNLTDDLLKPKVLFSLFSSWVKNIGQWLVDNTPQVLFKLVIFAFIIFIFRILKNLTRRMVTRAVSSPNLRMSQLMQDFFISMSGKGVFIIGLLIALSQIGLNLTPILTGFGVAGVIVGFALQDTLSNFASGMMLLIYRPFDVGDFVEAGGVSGKVSHMSLVSTTIKTFDNQIMIVPNSKIWGDTIKNVTHERVRRVDMVFGIGYSDSVEHAEHVLNDIVDAHPAVLKTPEKTIKLHTLNTSSIDFIVRPWVKTEDYWDVYWDITREVKIRFDKEGLSIPFPQQDVHLHIVNKKQDE
ncbi:mechanosensitive ion channel protein MscS [Photobacterium proteolyticum]|uniref:Small-conductance mechanosensitive channel n=1 Tax=Photobacterium proteolyticum TaxID=1903952 RepID=A0A1Q9GSH2_9GAMM|nr:mechanosensitive ion channel family protein [Photobacterium proteolyticum]OLQ77667.1 mechanosensitive ion channel protein MscS [Photobacterium proteolyticum]